MPSTTSSPVSPSAAQATPKNSENTTICRISLVAIASTIERRHQVRDELLHRERCDLEVGRRARVRQRQVEAVARPEQVDQDHAQQQRDQRGADEPGDRLEPTRPIALVSPMFAMPTTSVENTSGAMIILIRRSLVLSQAWGAIVLAAAAERRAVERIRWPVPCDDRDVHRLFQLPSPPIQKSGLPPLPKPAAGCPVPERSPPSSTCSQRRQRLFRRRPWRGHSPTLKIRRDRSCCSPKGSALANTGRWLRSSRARAEPPTAKPSPHAGSSLGARPHKMGARWFCRRWKCQVTRVSDATDGSASLRPFSRSGRCATRSRG